MVDEDLVNGKARDIRNSLAELSRLTSKKIEDMSIDEVYSVRYQIIVLVEAIVSLSSHIALEAHSYEPSSYKDSMAYVCRKENIKCAKDLEALVALRNLLIHRYWTIEDKQVYDSIRGNSKCIEEFLKKVVAKYG